MPLPAEWATPEDFATLFKYLWHRDFPIDIDRSGRKHFGATPADWTAHIGVVVRNIADLMGLYPRFEARYKAERAVRMDAVLRTADGSDVIALEWEWVGGWMGEELGKLRAITKDVTGKDGDRPLKYAVLITHSDEAETEAAYKRVEDQWKGAPWPLLFILVVYRPSPDVRRAFKNIHTSLFDSAGQRRDLLVSPAPALPGNIEGTKWYEPQRDSEPPPPQ
jgi:hypothetical protein